MLREAQYAETKKDLLYKKAFAQKEINETIYWLELLKATEYQTTEQYDSINTGAVETIKIITAIIKS